MIYLNKVLQKQLQQHFATLSNVPAHLLPLLRTISDTYDRQEQEKSVEEPVGMSFAAPGYDPATLLNASDQEQLFEGIGDSNRLMDFEEPGEKEDNQSYPEEDTRLLQQRLQESELRLKQAQTIAHFGTWEVDLVTDLAVLSEEACRIYGLPATIRSHTFDSWAAKVHPQDRPSFLKVITGGVESTETSAAFYHRICHDDGTLKYAYSQTKYDTDKEGMPVRLHGVTHDVTEMREAHYALVQSQANLRLLIDLIPQAIYARDSKGRFVFVNENYANLFGIEREQLLNMTIDEIIPLENDLEDFKTEDEEVLVTGQSKVIPESSFTDHNGVVRKYYTVKVPFVTIKNEQAVLGISMDITGQLKVDEERRKIIKDIMQRNNSLEQFSYIISHNLRSPIANILGIKAALQDPDITEDEKVYFTESLFGAVERLDVVIRDLSLILQIKNQVTENKQVVQFSEIVESIRLSISSLLLAAEAEIICDFAAVDEMLTIKSYLYSVFYNLISNSIKYRKPDEKPVIRIASAQTGTHIELLFSDNGIGIDVERYRSDLFGLYKRFHNHAEGKGMGLYMVKSQVETMGGRITMTSKVNVGTKFKIDFDVAEA